MNPIQPNAVLKTILYESPVTTMWSVSGCSHATRGAAFGSILYKFLRKQNSYVPSPFSAASALKRIPPAVLVYGISLIASSLPYPYGLHFNSMSPPFMAASESSTFTGVPLATFCVASPIGVPVVGCQLIGFIFQDATAAVSTPAAASNSAFSVNRIHTCLRHFQRHPH